MRIDSGAEQGFTVIEVLVVVVVVGLIGGAGWVWWSYNRPFIGDVDNSPTSRVTDLSSSLTPTSLPTLTLTELDSRYPTVESEAKSPDGAKTVQIRDFFSPSEYRSVIVLLVDNQVRVLLSEEPVGTEDWQPINEKNWSPDSKYIYINYRVPDATSADIFKTDGSLFSNGKPMINAGVLARKQLQSTWSLSVNGWLDNGRILLTQTGYGLIPTPPGWIPDSYVIYVGEETITKL